MIDACNNAQSVGPDRSLEPGQCLAMSKAAANGDQPVDRHVFFSRAHCETSTVGALSPTEGLEGQAAKDVPSEVRDDEDRISEVLARRHGVSPGRRALAAIHAKC